jgi:hypothetical protein
VERVQGSGFRMRDTQAGEEGPKGGLEGGERGRRRCRTAGTASALGERSYRTVEQPRGRGQKSEFRGQGTAETLFHGVENFFP